MEYELHRSIVSDHELVVDDKVFRELRQFTKVTEESTESNGKSTLAHTRFIGEHYYSVHQIMNQGQLEDEKIETNLETEEQIDNFKNEWEDGWSWMNGITEKLRKILNF